MFWLGVWPWNLPFPGRSRTPSNTVRHCTLQVYPPYDDILIRRSIEWIRAGMWLTRQTDRPRCGKCSLRRYLRMQRAKCLQNLGRFQPCIASTFFNHNWLMLDNEGVGGWAKNTRFGKLLILFFYVLSEWFGSVKLGIGQNGVFLVHTHTRWSAVSFLGGLCRDVLLRRHFTSRV